MQESFESGNGRQRLSGVKYQCEICRGTTYQEYVASKYGKTSVEAVVVKSISNRVHSVQHMSKTN
jgi:hypothetical protein